MSEINALFEAAPDLVRNGMDETQIARIILRNFFNGVDDKPDEPDDKPKTTVQDDAARF